MDLQKALNLMSDASRMTRSDYHLTLGAAIAWLEEVAPGTPATLNVIGTPGKVDSYRGYYADLAFEPQLEPVTAGEVLADLKAALGATFQGYKGGDFLMGEDTPLWVSAYGAASGMAVLSIAMIDGRAVFMTKQIGE